MMFAKPLIIAGALLAQLLAFDSAAQADPGPPVGPPAAESTPSTSTSIISAGGPLAPPDTSSPRASLTSFLNAVRAATALLIEAHREQQASSGLLSPEGAVRKADAADQLIQRAAKSFDFSAIPPSAQRSVRVESVLLLKEIIDRIPLPPLETIPGGADTEGQAARERQAPLQSWTIPGTEITFARVEDSTQRPQYLVSKETVSRLEEFYDLLDTRPPRPDATIDLYDYYSLTPGILLPPKWLSFITFLPDWLQASYLDEAMWQWIALIGGLLLGISIIVFAYRYEARARLRTSASPFARNLRRLVVPVVIALVALGFDYAMERVINVTGPVLRTVDAATFIVQVLAAAWAVLLAANGFVEWILETPKIPSDSLDANLLRAGFRVVGLVGAATILAHGATNLGIPLFGVIAGLGVGGLAIALAAQPTIENFIGGIILYADRPVRVGDECMFGDMRGFVEEIGIRSTRIRGLDRSIITVPNADFAKMRLVNLTRRDRMEVFTALGLRYETTIDQLHYVLERLREVLLANPLILREPLIVRLTGFADSALTVEVKAYVATPNRQLFLAIREELFLQFLEVIAEAGTALAFPSQTTYVGRDDGVDPDRQAAAEQTVSRWRAEGRLGAAGEGAKRDPPTGPVAVQRPRKAAVSDETGEAEG